ncbi:MAG: hypothetical protein QOE70_4634 [Chthoniobacter sp.]|jgi:hypothetical protein|nr:hypothetical protein [Chthoniobacter sp.]
MEAAVGAELIRQAGIVIDSPNYTNTTSQVLFALYRMMGMPRKWQMAGVEELEMLNASHRAIVRKAAVAVLSETKPGEKYVFIWEPHPGPKCSDLILELDLTNEDDVEKRHWCWTMPMVFVERLTRLCE